MTVRRVVTGQDAEGNSVLVADSLIEADTVDAFPGFEPHEVWAVDDTATVPAAGLPAPTTAYFPPVNGVRFQVIVFPPGAFARSEGPNDPAMHITDTVDYVYIASGEVTLELADGAEIDLHAGDTVVQQGTQHAWRNRSDSPCVVVGTLVGAHRAA
jgi:mannose-6-phosphate isomerase-like protein (cupin superfamily)